MGYEALTPRNLSDRELGFLTAHLLRVDIQNVKSQKVFDLIFKTLKLARFETFSLNQLDQLSPERVEYDLSDECVGFLVEAINRPMSGRFVRALGVGSAFFATLIQPYIPEEQETAPPAA